MARPVLYVFLSCVVAWGCAGEVDPAGAGADDDIGGSQEELLSGRPSMPAEAVRLLRSRHELTDEQLSRVYEVHHYVHTGRGRRIHLTEHFTLRSWLSWPHRGALLLSGPLGTGSFYNPDVDGYRFSDELAGEGFFVFAMDNEGSGESSYPDDGLTVTHDSMVRTARRVVRYIRLVRWIRRVDAVGESNGGAVAAELCADRRRVRSCVLSSMIYQQGTPFFEAVFQDPGFLAFLGSQPNGYIDAGPDLYFNVISRMSPEMAAETLATQPGRYAVAPLLVAASLPWFDPTRARVPALIIQGTEDNIAAQIDSDLLAADYGATGGGVATILRMDGAGHIPRVEPGPNLEWNAAVIDFLTTP